MAVLCFTAKLPEKAWPEAMPEFLALEQEIGGALQHLKSNDFVEECFALAAPGIGEIYMLATDVDSARKFFRLACGEASEGAGLLWENGVKLEGVEAVQHLLEIASGLAGEERDEAGRLSLIQSAVDSALISGACGGRLAILGRRAIRLGTEIRASNSDSVMLSQICEAASRLVRKIHSKPAAINVMVAGSGDTARAVANEFHRVSVGSLTFAAADNELSGNLAREFGGTSLPLEGITEALEHCEVLVTATHGGKTPIDNKTLLHLLQRRRIPLAILDLSNPPWLTPSIAHLENVFWYDRRALESIMTATEVRGGMPHKSIDLRAAALQTLRLVEWPPVKELLDDLRVRADSIRQQHLERFGRKLGSEERLQFSGFTDSLVSTVLNDVAANIEGIDPDTPQGVEAFEAMRRLLGVSSAAGKEQ